MNRLSFSEAYSRKAGMIAAIAAIEEHADALARRHVATLRNRGERIHRTKRGAY